MTHQYFPLTLWLFQCVHSCIASELSSSCSGFEALKNKTKKQKQKTKTKKHKQKKGKKPKGTRKEIKS